MRSIRIGIVSYGGSLTKRTWVKQDIDLLRESGFDVVFIALERGFLRSLKKILSCHLLFGWFAYHDSAFYARTLRRMSILNAVGSEVAYYPEFNYGLARRTYMRPFIAQGLKSADKVIAESTESARWAEFWGKRRAQIVYEGINTDKFKPSGIHRDGTHHVLLAVANLEKDIVPRKNLSTLISAMKLVVEQMHNARLVIAGEKLDGYPPLRAQVERLGLEHNVVFKGKVSDQELVYLYTTSNIFVMPSLQEGFPTVCCEALSCETPVITSNRPSMNEVFTNNVNAVLIDPNDQVKMANAIVRVLKDRNLAERLGKKGRELVIGKFSRDVRKDKLKKVINEVINKRKRFGGIDTPFLIFYCTSKMVLLTANALMRLLRR